MGNIKLPTFSRWGKKIYARKRGILIALLLWICFLAYRESVRRYFSVPLSCDQPCPAMSGCEPLSLTLEIAPSKLKLGESPNLWYRAKLTNRTCMHLSVINAEGFVDSSDLRNVGPHAGLWLSVIGPDGKEVTRNPKPGPDGGIAWSYEGSKGVDVSTLGVIHPYQPNFVAIDRLRALKKLSDSYFADLEPGESFVTIEPVVRPYRIVATSFRTDDGGFADGFGKVAVENPPNFPIPPKEFNVLDRYVFSRPGRYRVRAGYRTGLLSSKVYPHWEKHPLWMDFSGVGLDSKDWHVENQKVEVVADEVIVEVVR